MSFNAIRNSAYSSLMATQVKMQITAANIANADTVGYTRKMASQTSLTYGGIGAGVSVTNITSAVNEFLVKDIAKALTEFGAAEVINRYSDELQVLFGTVNSDSEGVGDTIAHTISELETALERLAGTPETSNFKNTSVAALEALTNQLRTTSIEIQQMRANADGEIAKSVDTANNALHAIALLNKQIVQTKTLGQPTGDLQDMRNNAVQTLSEQMDIHYYINSNDEMQINTLNGTPLLNSRVHELNYAAQPVVDPSTTFNKIMIDGEDVTGELKSGIIGGSIAMRDGTLKDVQAELDELAVNLIGALNEAYNDSMTIPPLSALTGSKPVAGTDAFDGTGTMRIAILDNEGVALKVLDIDLDALADPTTVQDLINGINAANNPGADPAIANIASIGTGGTLVLAAPAGLGIAMTDLDSEVPNADPALAAKGVSAYFGLNDLVTGTSAGSMRVRSDIQAKSSLFSNGQLSTDPGLAAGEGAFTYSASFLQNMADLFSDVRFFADAGALGEITTSLSDYAATIVDHVATNSSEAEDDYYSRQTGKQVLLDAMASQTGVNLQEENAMVLELDQAFATAAKLFEVLNSMFDALLQAAKSA